MIVEILKIDDYVGTISYDNGFENYDAKSRRYRIKIEKCGEIKINHGGCTLSGARTDFYRWVAKNTKS